jgi:hypothetical protein
MNLIIALIENRVLELQKGKFISEKALKTKLDDADLLYHNARVRIYNKFIKQADKALKLLKENN